MDAKDEETFTVLADGETTRDRARDKPGPTEHEENQGERILYSTVQVLPRKVPRASTGRRWGPSFSAHREDYHGFYW